MLSVFHRDEKFFFFENVQKLLIDWHFVRRNIMQLFTKRFEKSITSIKGMFAMDFNIKFLFLIIP